MSEDASALNAADCARGLERCCGSRRWVEAMMQRRPFASPEQVYACAEECFGPLAREDWLEAFRHHPRIGDVKALREKFAATAAWAGAEQSGAAAASEAVLQALSQGNADYEKRFGYIFIVCATGKSAEEMLALLRARIDNDPETELKLAAAEQAKITALRLGKWMRGEA